MIFDIRQFRIGDSDVTKIRLSAVCSECCLCLPLCFHSMSRIEHFTNMKNYVHLNAFLS